MNHTEFYKLIQKELTQDEIQGMYLVHVSHLNALLQLFDVHDLGALDESELYALIQREFSHEQIQDMYLVHQPYLTALLELYNAYNEQLTQTQ